MHFPLFISALYITVLKIRTASPLVGLIVGGVVFSAAILKTYAVVYFPIATNYVMGSRLLTVGLIGVELLLGAGLIIGIYLNLSRSIAIGVFVVFATFALYSIVENRRGCSCLGLVDVPPGGMFVINALALAALLSWAPKPTIGSAWKKGAALCMLVAVSALVIMLSTRPDVSLSADGTVVGSRKVIALDPSGWEGRPFPARNFVRGRADLSRGEWTVIFFDWECPKCQAILRSIGWRRTQRVAMICTCGAESLPSDTSQLVWLRLDPGYHWLIEIPLEITLTDGIVVGVNNRF